MKKHFILGLVIVSMMLICSAGAYALPPACNATTACNCGNLLTESRVLDENDNLTECNGTGLQLSTGVTLDCNGYSITGNGTGSGVSPNDGTLVKNCIISNFTYGISASGPAALSFDNNTIYDTEIAMYLIPDSAYVNITHSTIFDSDTGISVEQNTQLLTIEHNNIYDVGDYAVYISNLVGNGSSISHNSINNVTAGYGMYLTGLDSTDFTENTVFGCYYSGMYFEGSVGNTISGGEVSDNNAGENGGEGGIVLASGSDGNTVTGIEAHNNKRGGAVYVDSSNGNAIEYSNINDNCGDMRQIYIVNADSTTVQNNNVTDGTGNGIEIIDSTTTAVVNNNISGNCGAGVYIDSYGVGSSSTLILGNTIDNNGACGSSYWGVSVTLDDDVSISDNNFSSNVHGAVYCVGSTVDVQDGNYVGNGYDWNNDALYAESGTLDFTATGAVTCTDNSITATTVTGFENIVRDNCPVSFEGSCGGAVDCECGDIVLEDYSMTGDLYCSGDGLIIGASDVTLDCNDYGISGDGPGSGITVSPGSDRVTITHCEISNFAYGINNDDPMADSGDNLTVEYNTIYDTAIAVYSRQVDNWVKINHNEIYSSDYGIDVYDSSEYDEINSNVIYDITNDAIRLMYADYAQVSSNQINNAGGDGIYLYSVYDSSVSGNTINEAGVAIELSSSSTTTVQANTLSNFTSDAGIKVHTGSGSNIITGNNISCTDSGLSYSGILMDGSITPSENNQLSSNEAYYCEYGLYVSEVVYFSADSETYHDNWYGAYLSDVGYDDETMPQITESDVYNNIDGVYVTGSSYVYIENTDFTDNHDITTGLHVGFSSVVYLNNGDFISNSVYGISADGYVYWTLDEDVYCTDNDIMINEGWIVPLGGKIIAENCDISVNGEAFNLSGGQVGYYIESFSAGMPDFGNADYGVSGEIYTLGGYPGGDLVVKFYDENPGGSGFYLEEFGLWIDASLDPDPGAALDWWMLKIYYTDEELAASGLSESNLEIQFYNATDGTWFKEPNQGVDTVNNYVWANLTHFSVFGIFGSAVSGGGGSTSRCSDECDSGEVVCRDGSMLVCQYSSSLGCWKWYEEYCALNEECVGGKCVKMACVEDWMCDNWGECLGGVQSRSCEDWNSCGTSAHMPATSRACAAGEAAAPAEEVPPAGEEEMELAPQKSKSALIGGILIAAIVVAIALKFGLGSMAGKKKP